MNEVIVLVEKIGFGFLGQREPFLPFAPDVDEMKPITGPRIWADRFDLP